MGSNLLLGFWRAMFPVPRVAWQGLLKREAQKVEERLDFMSQEHRLVHHFVVREIPRMGEPLSPDFVAQELDLPIARVNVILDELEKHMTFLFRNEQGAVTWAYPVTVDQTPHQVSFSTGEQIYAA